VNLFACLSTFFHRRNSRALSLNSLGLLSILVITSQDSSEESAFESRGIKLLSNLKMRRSLEDTYQATKQIHIEEASSEETPQILDKYKCLVQWIMLTCTERDWRWRRARVNIDSLSGIWTRVGAQGSHNITSLWAWQKLSKFRHVNLVADMFLKLINRR
jgi:hypothetical protein